MSKKKKVIFSMLSFAFVAILSCGVIFLPDWSQKDEVQKNMLSETEAATTPTNTSGTWIDSGRRGTSFGGGSGTESEPYLISNAQQLAYLAYIVNNGNSYSGKYFKQTANIDLSAYYWNPIGTLSYKFSGNFDGSGCIISGLFTQSGKSYQGLFGHADEAVLANIIIQDSLVVGSSYVGSIVGMSSGGLIKNCHNFANVQASSSSVGGIAGSAMLSSDGSIEANVINCMNEGNVSGTSYVGGIASVCFAAYCSNNGDISGSSSVGGIIAAGIVKNCINNGDVAGGTLSTGGIVAECSSYEVEKCYNTGDVTGAQYVGGIVGMANYGFVKNCYNEGNVTNTSQDTNSAVGGICGYAISSQINNCYNDGYYDYGIIQGAFSTGGIVGYFQGTVSNCYNLGKVSSSVNGAGVGGIVGWGSSTISSCYYGRNCSSSVGGVNGADTTGAKYLSGIYSLARTPSWYTTSSNWNSAYPWDLDKVWFVGESLPSLKMELIYDYDFSGYSLAGSGSSSDPYRIRSEQDLAFLSWTIVENKPYGHTPSGEGNFSSPRFFYSNKYFRQEKDLDFSNLGWWQPIGVDSSASPNLDGYNYFSGNYDGQGFDIIGIVTCGESGGNGLFGFAGGASTSLPVTIKNVNMKSCNINVGAGILSDSEGNCYISNCSVSGKVYLAGIVSYINELNTRIENCVNYATIQGGTEVAGIVTRVDAINLVQEGVTKVNDIVVENCVNFGNIIGNDITGGIAGYASAIGIKNCLNVGKIISVGDQAGGIAGYSGGDTLLQNCLNLGDVSGESCAGGLVGYVSLMLGNTTIENCGTEGKVESAGVVGGLVGEISNSLNIYDSTFKMTNCFASVEMTGSAIIGEYDNSEGEVSYDKIVMLVNGTTKRYVGSDFSAFIWINSSSCPVLKSFAWLQSLWPSTVTETNLRNAGWTKVSV